MAESGRFGNVVEGDEVERFLQQFVAPEGQSFSTLPSTVEAVLEDVRDIWAEKGLLSPAELKAELLVKYMPEGTDPAVTGFIHDMELSRNQPEHTTGYLSKEHAYIATGLAHLYAVETGRPVAHMESDFSNMGGTNLFFKEMLQREAQEQGLDISPADLNRQAEAMTDKAVLLLSASITADIQQEFSGVKIIPIRTGGDETRVHFEGVDPAEYGRLTDIVHASIERHVAHMGLQDHAHLKAPGDNVRNGFGAALTTIDMRGIEDPATLIRDLDGEIKVTKDQLGLMRLGTIDVEMARAEIAAGINAGAREIPAGYTMDEAIAIGMSERAALAHTASETLHKINPDARYNGLRTDGEMLDHGSAAFHQYVDKQLSLMGQTPILSSPLPEILQQDMIGANRPVGVAPLASLEERRMALIEMHFREGGIELNPMQRQIMELGVSGLTAKDPAAQTLMPADMIKNMNVFAAENAQFRQNLGVENPMPPQALGVSFHGLASLNSTLGHHTADVALRHMGAGIIEKALHDAGIPDGKPKPYEIAHHGGGNFTVLVKPGGIGEDGAVYAVSNDTMAAVSKNISMRTNQFNNTGITKFLETNGVKVDADLADYLKNKGLETFSDLQDTKERSVEIDGESMKGNVNGIHAVSVARPLDGDSFHGQTFISGLRREAEAKMDRYREEKVMAMNGQERSVGPSPVISKFTAFTPESRADHGSQVQESHFMGGKRSPATPPETPTAKPYSTVPPRQQPITSRPVF
jgi:hypothetical protein